MSYILVVQLKYVNYTMIIYNYICYDGIVISNQVHRYNVIFEGVD